MPNFFDRTVNYDQIFYSIFRLPLAHFKHFFLVFAVGVYYTSGIFPSFCMSSSHSCMRRALSKFSAATLVLHIAFSSFAFALPVLVPVAEAVAPSADLSIIKMTTSSSVATGGSVTYTVTITNNSATTDSGGVSITDIVPSGMAFSSYTDAGGSDSKAITCSGTSTITCSIGGSHKLDATKTKIVTLTFTVTSTTCGASITNSAAVSASTNDPSSGNNTASASAITIACGHIIVDKVTNPSHYSQSFTFHPSWTADFGLTDDSTPQDSGGIAPGTYSVSENAETDWVPTGASCISSNGEPETPESISLQAGETVTCTFTNTKNGTVIIHKETLPDGAEGSFDFSGDLGSFSLSDGQSSSFSVAPDTTKNVTEGEDSAVWKLVDGYCDNGTFLDGHTLGVSVDPDQTVNCYFYNLKHTIIDLGKTTTDTPNEDDGGTFDFTGTAGSSSSATTRTTTTPNTPVYGVSFFFDIFTEVTFNHSSSSLAPPTPQPVPIEMLELHLTGWNPQGVQCSGNASSAASSVPITGGLGVSVQGNAGENISCLFTNTKSTCGNSVIESGETCDDGNTIDGDGCTAISCQIESGYSCISQPSVCTADCGDGLIAGSEQCDLGGENSNTGSCTLTCQNAQCGDGFTQPSNDEECDNGVNNSNNGACTVSCKLASCGDGFIQSGEQCDDSGTANGDGCSSLCQLESGYSCTGEPSACALSCGNGVVEPGLGETCDDSNTVSGDGCTSLCHDEVPLCNGQAATIYVNVNDLIRGGTHDGNAYTGTLQGTNDNDVMVGTDGADNIDGKNGDDVICGRGGNDTISGGGGNDTISGEAGDDAITGGNGTDAICGGTNDDGLKGDNDDDKIDGGDGTDDINGGGGADNCVNGETASHCENTDGGVTECSAGYAAGGSAEAVCGNSVVETGEQCDDGNTASGDGCSNVCVIESDSPSCGNGQVNGQEQCDDGNESNNDACLNSCQNAVCGDGVVRTDTDTEQCDDGNTVNGDGCSSLCVIEEDTGGGDTGGGSSDAGVSTAQASTGGNGTNGNGGHRGGSSNVPLGFVNRLLSALGFVNGVPPPAFGGSDEALQKIICPLQLKGSNRTYPVIAHLVAGVTGLDEQTLLADLRDPEFCSDYSAERHPTETVVQQAKERPVGLAADGYPLSLINHVWNLCVRGKATLADIRSNPDVFVSRSSGKVIAKSCDSYRTTGTNIWQYPDDPFLTFIITPSKKGAPVVHVPNGFAVVPFAQQTAGK